MLTGISFFYFHRFLKPPLMGGFFVPKIHDWEDDYDKHAF